MKPKASTRIVKRFRSLRYPGRKLIHSLATSVFTTFYRQGEYPGPEIEFIIPAPAPEDSFEVEFELSLKLEFLLFTDRLSAVRIIDHNSRFSKPLQYSEAQDIRISSFKDSLIALSLVDPYTHFDQDCAEVGKGYYKRVWQSGLYSSVFTFDANAQKFVSFSTLAGTHIPMARDAPCFAMAETQAIDESCFEALFCTFERRPREPASLGLRSDIQRFLAYSEISSLVHHDLGKWISETDRITKLLGPMPSQQFYHPTGQLRNPPPIGFNLKFIPLGQISHILTIAALRPILNSSLGRRFKAGLVRPAQTQLIRMALELAMHEMNTYTLRLASHLDSAARAKLCKEKRLKTRFREVVPRSRAHIKGLRWNLDVDSLHGGIPLVVSIALVKYRARRIRNLMSFIVQLRSESIETRIGTYLGKREGHRCIEIKVDVSARRDRVQMQRVCYICG